MTTKMNLNQCSKFVFLLTVFAAAVVLATCQAPPTGEQREITVLYTNDEHGWMQGVQSGQGAAHLVGLLQEENDYQVDQSVILLSGGDNWTGPAISTWFEGQSMVEVMNQMGYSASVIGNHEFDFGLEVLKQRIAEANYPYLSANIRNKSDGEIPHDLGVEPFSIIEVSGIKVALLGLTTTLTPAVTNPAIVADYDFIEYETALREFVPIVREQGAELILVPSHICTLELAALAARVSDLGITMLGGGHCNEFLAEQVAGTVIISGGYHYTGYAYATFSYDLNTQEIQVVDVGIRQNKSGAEDPLVTEIVQKWQDKTDLELNTSIGYLRSEIPRRSQTMQALITESWLWGYPNADIALTNLGGIRDSLRAGDITLADVVSILPFNNVLVDVILTGDQLLQVLAVDPGGLAIGGMHQEGGTWLLDTTRAPLDGQQTYHVLVNDFMYAGGDDYTLLAQFDPDAYNTAIDWRQPVIDWIADQGSSEASPIDDTIATLKDL